LVKAHQIRLTVGCVERVCEGRKSIHCDVPFIVSRSRPERGWGEVSGSAFLLNLFFPPDSKSAQCYHSPNASNMITRKLPERVVVFPPSPLPPVSQPRRSPQSLPRWSYGKLTPTLGFAANCPPPGWGWGCPTYRRPFVTPRPTDLIPRKGCATAAPAPRRRGLPAQLYLKLVAGEYTPVANVVPLREFGSQLVAGRAARADSLDRGPKMAADPHLSIRLFFLARCTHPQNVIFGFRSTRAVRTCVRVREAVHRAYAPGHSKSTHFYDETSIHLPPLSDELKLHVVRQIEKYSVRQLFLIGSDITTGKS